MSRSREPPYETALLIASLVVAVGMTAVVSVTVFGVGDRLRAERTNGSFTFDRTEATYRVGQNGMVSLDAVAITYERGLPILGLVSATPALPPVAALVGFGVFLVVARAERLA